MKVGQKIRNIHTHNIYTIVDVERIKYDGVNWIWVYEVSNELLESHRFNEEYVKHYEVIGEEE